MAKPICIIKVDMTADFGGGQTAKLYELNEMFEKRLPDYHVFVLPQADDRAETKELFVFQVFYDRDFTSIEYSELKKIIEDSLN